MRYRGILHKRLYGLRDPQPTSFGIRVPLTAVSARTRQAHACTHAHTSYSRALYRSFLKSSLTHVSSDPSLSLLTPNDKQHGLEHPTDTATDPNYTPQASTLIMSCTSAFFL